MKRTEYDNQYKQHEDMGSDMKEPDSQLLTTEELRIKNPWQQVIAKYVGNGFLCQEKDDLVLDQDESMIREFNSSVEKQFQYRLNVPVFPWYGNPLSAKVIVLSLNPAYTDHQAKICKVLMNLPANQLEGFPIHLRSMLTFDCQGFLPNDGGNPEMTYRDLANIHQTWYWWDRLQKGFVNDETGLDMNAVVDKFAIIQYVAYSSEKYKPFKGGKLLPSQHFTKQLIQYILYNTEDTIFIVPRNVKVWKKFLGSLWTGNERRFITTTDYFGQRLTKGVMKDDDYGKIIKAFKS